MMPKRPPIKTVKTALKNSINRPADSGRNRTRGRICGTLHSVDQYLNIKLTDISVTDPDKYPHMRRHEVCFTLTDSKLGLMCTFEELPLAWMSPATSSAYHDVKRDFACSLAKYCHSHQGVEFTCTSCWNKLSVKNCFIRGSVVRYVQLPVDEVDTNLLQDASRKESNQIDALASLLGWCRKMKISAPMQPPIKIFRV
ncbi:U6 snRNA-associated Sm-like protein LSm2 [Nymphon striatum]|nr:U6 snRNA-associated Sm-like protein LSm2 [Nymphon striatum]